MASSRTPPISGMWAMLQKENRLPKNSILSSCESELQELMRQIDLMVHTKKADWDREKQQLMAKIKVREQEYVIQKSTLDNRQSEVGQLRNQLEAIEKQRRDMATEYEKQLGSLRNEVARMKRDYERLQKKYSRHAKDVQRDKSKASTELDDYAGEIKRLTAKNEEHRQKSREWDQMRRSMQKQIEELEAQKKTLGEKCQFVQQQSQTYQSQLDKRTELLGSTELSLQAQITQVEGQLHRARDTINSQDTQLSRLKASLEEAVSAQRGTLEDKEKMEKELRKAQQSIRQLEESSNTLSVQVSEKDETIRTLNTKVESMFKEKNHLEQLLASKDQEIKKRDSKGGEESSRIRELQDQLLESRTDNRKAKKNEKCLREEIADQRAHIEALEQSSPEDYREGSDTKNLEAEIAQLKSQIENLQSTHSAELGHLRTESAELNADLNQRNLAMASLSEKAANMERALRENNDSQERKQAELHVSNAQLEALRIENRHLRRAALGKTSTSLDESSGDVPQAERHLKDLQAAYKQSITTLEKQNERLKADNVQLEHELRKTHQSVEHKVTQALNESQRTVQRVRDEDEKCIAQIEQHADSRVRAAEERLNDTINDYEARLHRLQQDVANIEGERTTSSSAMKRLGMENAVMAHFVEGVDNIVRQRPTSAASYPRQSPSLGFPAISPRPGESPDSFLDEDFLVDSADLATAQFLAEQNERTRDLERKLNMHIEDLKTTTDATIRKYTSR